MPETEGIISRRSTRDEVEKNNRLYNTTNRQINVRRNVRSQTKMKWRTGKDGLLRFYLIHLWDIFWITKGEIIFKIKMKKTLRKMIDRVLILPKIKIYIFFLIFKLPVRVLKLTSGLSILFTKYIETTWVEQCIEMAWSATAVRDEQRVTRMLLLKTKTLNAQQVHHGERRVINSQVRTKGLLK